MTLSTQSRLRYVAPLNDFNPRAYWDEWQDRQRKPWVYLDAVGIERICDMLFAGLSPKEISRTIGLGLAVILKWIDGDDYRREQYEWALNAEADNMMFEARDVIRDAPLVPEAINKAGKLAEHYRHMSKGFGQKRWGQKVDVNANIGVSLNYHFDVGLTEVQKAKAIEGESRRVEALTAPVEQFDINNMLGAAEETIPLGTGLKDELTSDEARGNEE